jgi:hypothetical protein
VTCSQILVPTLRINLVLHSDKYSNIVHVGQVAQLVQRLATGWTVGGSNPGGGDIFRSCPDRPWGPPSLLYHVYLAFAGGRKQQGRNAGPSPHSSAEV